MNDETPPIAKGQILNVWRGTDHIGQLIREGEAIQQLSFIYSKDWLSTPGNFPLSITMPLSQDKYPSEIVYPWFHNLLPEGAALQTVANILKVVETDVFGALARIGHDVPGGIEIRRPEERPDDQGHFGASPPEYRPLTEVELAETLRKLPERPMLVGVDGISMSMAGAQNKLPVARLKSGEIALALNNAPTTHIIKPQPKNLRAAVENEAFCMRLAAAIKLPAAKVEMGMAEDVSYILVERYDREMSNGDVRRIHQEDFCQTTGNLPFNKYEFNPHTHTHGPTLKTCLDSLEKTSSPGVNKVRFLDYLIFNIACGNVDAHAKNYSILLTAENKQRMTPIYDVMNGDIYPDVTRNLAMKIAGKNRGDYLFGRHWERMAKENDFSQTMVKRRVAATTEAILREIDGVTAKCNEERRSEAFAEIAGYIRSHCRNLQANIDTEPKEGIEEEPEESIEDENTTAPGVKHISP